MLTEKQIENSLRQVIDPELGVNIVDLGLIYKISVSKGAANILMTLTFPGCPLGSIINEEIRAKLAKIKEIKKVNLKITFDPPWDLSKIKPEVAAELGINR